MNYKKDLPVIHPKDIFIGDPDASITLTEYGDYECETALYADLIVKEILQRYPGLVRFNYRHFPLLRLHQRAHKAAEASIAAGQQGKFAQMHDLLLHNRRNLGTASLAFYARELGINSMNFLDALITGKFGQYVHSDIALGMRLGVKTAPSFFINSKRLDDKVSVKSLSDSIESVLQGPRTTKPKKAVLSA
jgi:protein-disulfide isomerase